MNPKVFLSIVLISSSAFAADRVTLTGTVNDQDRQPLARATVIIYTAGPRYGQGVLCPSCYADCGKRAVADSEGRYRIESLDPELTFSILAVAEGYKPKVMRNVDPTDGAAHLFMEKLSLDKLGPDQVVRGRVLGPDGQPVVGASVDVYGLTIKEGEQWGGVASKGIDELAITDEKGLFIITGQSPFLGLALQISAPGMARRIFKAVPPRDKVADFQLDRGAAITGRLLHDGKPLAGIVVGAVQNDRSAGTFLGEATAVTDPQGRFNLDALPADQDLYVYAKMLSLGKRGVVPARLIHSAANEGTTDLGDLLVTAGHRLAGRVKLSDNQPVPSGTTVLISQRDAWDFVYVEADAEGRFDAPAAIPAGGVEVTTRIPGYRLATTNLSITSFSEMSLTGIINRDITDLLVLMDPAPDGASIGGPFGKPEHVRAWTQRRRIYQQRKYGPDKPLRGAEVRPGDTPVAPPSPGSTYSIRGQVQRSDGSPAPNVEIRMAAYDSAQAAGFRGLRGTFEIDMAMSNQLAIQSHIVDFAATKTDENGRFEITNVLAGHSVNLFYWGEGVPKSCLENVDQLEDRKRQNLSLRAVPVARLTGRVNRKAQPAITAIELRSEKPPHYFRHTVRLTATQEQYDFPDVPAGSYIISVKGPPKYLNGKDGPYTDSELTRLPIELPPSQTTTRDVGF